jgi:cyclophilin family peptidyl-prolyl cis-trans isomerase
MVQVQLRPKLTWTKKIAHFCCAGLIAQVLFFCIISIFDFADSSDLKTPLRSDSHPPAAKIGFGPNNCPYKSLSDLTEEERVPAAGPNRHIVDPPGDTKITLVCCDTTVGPWSIAVHHSWAPFGAKRFVDMVRAGYFGKVPLMRCVERFICQFGLKGKLSEEERHFSHPIPDDKPWLPKGPTHRKNKVGVKRFAKGYFAFAGSGVASRSDQLIVGLQDNGMLAGGSPWETPWGELVGEHSSTSLDKVYTGYGEEGPSQGLLSKEDAFTVVASKFPKLDYILSCQVIDEQERRS